MPGGGGVLVSYVSKADILMGSFPHSLYLTVTQQSISSDLTILQLQLWPSCQLYSPSNIGWEEL